jgi:hypothetical protein
VERAVAWLSAACAVHCLLVPLAAALLPLLGASSQGLLGGADPILTVLVVAGGAASALFGFRRHRDLRLSLGMAACIALYLTGHLIEPAWYGRALAVLGGIGLALLSFASARLGHAHSESCAH